MADLSPLHKATFRGDLASVKKLVEGGHNIDEPAPDKCFNRSPLQMAIECKQNHVARYLLEKNCNVEQRDIEGCTPFLIACYFNNMEMVQLLHERGVDTSALMNRQSTGLHMACWQGNNSVVQYLLTHQLCHINHMDKFGDTALHDAVGWGRPLTVEMLLKHQAHILKKKNGQTTIDLAIAKLEKIQVKQNKDNEDKRMMTDVPKCIHLLRTAVDSAKTLTMAKPVLETMSSLSPLHEEAKRGDLTRVKKLVEAGFNIDEPASDKYCNRSPLQIAIRNGNNHVAKYLLEKNCDVLHRDNFGRTPFLLACYVNLEMVQLLHERGVDTSAVDEEKLTGLHLACWNGNNPVVRYLLVHQLCHIDHMDKFGHTALHGSSCKGWPLTVELLLKHQPRILKNKDGQTPFDLAIAQLEYIQSKQKKHKEDKRMMTGITKCIHLLRAAADSTLPPLHEEAKRGDLTRVKILVEVGSNIDEPASDLHHKYSPLQTAIRHEQNPVAKYLLEQNCDVEQRDSLGRTPFLIACIYNLEMVQLLHERGVDTFAVSNSQSTGLHQACRHGNNPVVQYLLAHQLCHIDHIDKFGDTALDDAVHKGMPSVVNMLLKNQALILKNKDEQTPYDTAKAELEKVQAKENKNDDGEIIAEQALSSYPSRNQSARGYCLIIANFTKEPKIGTCYTIDCCVLKQFFEDVLQFNVKIIKNQKKEQLLIELARTREMFNRQCLHDRFFFFILSHGDTHGIKCCQPNGQTFDGCYVTASEIIGYFTHDQVPSLNGFPKLFFIQACQGTNQSFAAGSPSGDAVSVAASSPLNITVGADILVCKASQEGTYAWVEENRGSWFIQELMRVFKEHRATEHVLDMLTEVVKMISERASTGNVNNQDIDEVRQIPEVCHKLRAKLYI